MNENNDKITIIIPVYNVEKYIDKCLNSVINQTYKNLQIIIVNDGSKDNSEDICKKYQKKDKRIICLTQKNHGVSNARNVGLNYANGKYIIFIDSDDWLEPDMIEVLYFNSIKNEADISICDYYMNYENKEIAHNKLAKKIILQDKSKILEELFDINTFGGYLWNKLIKRECIYYSNNKYTKFNEEVKIQEDILFLTDIVQKANKVIYMPQEKKYHYRIRENSAVNFSYSQKDLTKLIAMEQFIKLKHQYMIENLTKIEYDYYTLARQGIYILAKENLKDLKLESKIEDISKKYFKIAMKEANQKEKIRAILLLLFPKHYGKIMDKYKYK